MCNYVIALFSSLASRVMPIATHQAGTVPRMAVAKQQNLLTEIVA